MSPTILPTTSASPSTRWSSDAPASSRGDRPDRPASCSAWRSRPRCCCSWPPRSGSWARSADPAPPALVSTYHGGPARTGVMPGPAPEGWPQVAEDGTVGMKGAFGTWGPAVVNGLVITGDQSGNVTATDLASRTMAWTVKVGAPINSAPTVAGDLVLVGDDAGILHALRLTDRSEAWHWVAPSGAPIHGAPAVLGDVVVVASLAGDLAALDVATGARRWETEVGGGIGRAIAAADGLVYVGVGGSTPADDGSLQARDIATGALRWSQPLQPGDTATPAVADGRVFVAGGLDARPGAPHALYAFDAVTGEPAWSAPWTSDTGGSLYIDSVADGMVMVGSSDGRLLALDAATGTVRWHLDDVGPALSPNGGFVGGTLYAAVGEQRILAVDARTGAPIWAIAVKGEPSAPTIVDGHVLVVTTLGKLVWIDGGGPAQTLDPLPSSGD